MVQPAPVRAIRRAPRCAPLPELRPPRPPQTHPSPPPAQFGVAACRLLRLGNELLPVSTRLVKLLLHDPLALRRLTLHVYAPPAAEKEVIDRLLRVPEIASSNMRLQIHIAP